MIPEISASSSGTVFDDQRLFSQNRREMHDLLRTMVPNYEEGPVKWENWGHGTSPKDLLDIARNDKVIYNNLMDYLKEDQEFFDKVKWHESN